MVDRDWAVACVFRIFVVASWEVTTPEGRVKNEVKKQLKALGAYHFWAVQTGLGATTVDCLACFHGRFVGIETKAPGKKPTPRQEVVLTQIREAGGITLVIDSVAMARLLPEIIDDLGINRAPGKGAGHTGGTLA